MAGSETGPTDAPREAALDRISNNGFINREALARVVAAAPRMHACRNAEPRGGHHPLVVGLHARIEQYAPLAEYLASRGYVVAVTPMTGSFQKAFDAAASGSTSELHDGQFVQQQMTASGLADPARTAVMGWSFGSIAAGGWVVRDSRIRAWISLGWRLRCAPGAVGVSGFALFRA